MSNQETTSEQAPVVDWKSYKGKEVTFFEVEKFGRVLKVGVHLKPEEKGNIVWHLSTRTQNGKLLKFYLKLDEMEELGFLLLLLSRFCAETRYLNEKNFAQIHFFKDFWDNLRHTEKE